MKWALAALALAGCAGAPARLPPPAGRPREVCACRTPPPIERGDGGELSGPWEQVGQAAAPGAVVRCAEGYRTVDPEHFSVRSWTLKQNGERVQLWASLKTIRQDGNLTSSEGRCEAARGAADGGVFLITGIECSEGPTQTRVYEGMPARSLQRSHPVAKPVSYELRLEPASGHLVGSRNGAPVRLAPVTFVKQGKLCFERSP